ncbi:unnamed protein product [Rhodiola kirilowii]
MRRTSNLYKDRHERRDKAPEWVVNINAILELEVVYDSSKKWTIYRVPTNLLKIHSNAFVPKIISIGPFHYRDLRLRAMDEHKERYLLRLLGGKLSKSLTKKYQEEVVKGGEITKELSEQDNAAVPGNGGEITEELAEQDNAAVPGNGGEIAEELAEQDNAAVPGNGGEITEELAEQENAAVPGNGGEITEELAAQDNAAVPGNGGEIAEELAEQDNAAVPGNGGEITEELAEQENAAVPGNGGEITEELAAQDNAVEGGVKKVTMLEVLEGAMRKLMYKTRETYSEVVTMSNEKFVEMMVLDGCFVVELLRLYHKSLKDEFIDDAIFTTRWMLRTLQRDLLMLENQLPFFVLEELYELTKLDEQEPPLISLVLEFLNPLLPRTNYVTKFKNVVPEHILDVLLLSFISPMQKKVTNSSWSYMTQNNRSSYVNRAQERQLIHCVTELQEVGVLFRRGEDKNLLDINFSNGILQIPPLYINDNTVPIFLNFLAYEQCDQEAEPYFTNFFTFLDGLISSSKDIKILHQYEIINHALGSKENVANLFNKVCRELVFDVDHCYVSQQMVEVNQYRADYYATKWHVWKTNLIHDYFNSPWTALSLGAAILMLILSALHTVYSAITFYHH